MNIELGHSLPRFVELLQRAPGVIMRHVDQAVQRVAIEGTRIMRQDAPKNASELVNSIRNEQLAQAFHAVVATAPHAGYVHDGTPPGSSPPIDALRAWIRTARIRPTQARNTRDLAFLIQRKIRQRGIPARPFSQRTVQTSQDRLRTLIPQAVDRASAEVFG